MKAHSLAIAALSDMEYMHRDKQYRQQQAAKRHRGSHNFTAYLDAVLDQELASRADMHLKYGPEAVKIADVILRQNIGRF